MSINLAIFALWICALLAVGLTLATRVAGTSVRGQRFAWAASMALAVALLFAAPIRARLAVLETSQVQPVDPGALALLADGLGAPLATISHATSGLPAWLAPLSTWLWALSSMTFIAAFAASYGRHRRAVDRATEATVAGTTVRVVDGLGPAVVGVLRPHIVVPSWLLDRPDSEQRLIVRHELAHVAVGDPLLLLAGCAALALMPWNPAMWYLLGRLRLAIELDCDRRVLAAGARAREYGTALIELTALLPRRTGGIGAPAFAYRPSHLERRLAAMTAQPISFRRIRLAAAGALAAAALLVACDSELPTSAQIEDMGVTEVELQGSPLLRSGNANTQYLVDGVLVTREVAVAVPADKISRIEIARASLMKGAPPTGSEVPASDVASIHVITTDAPELLLQPDKTVEGQMLKRPFLVGEVDKGPSGAPTMLIQRSKSDTTAFEGVLVIDGIIADRSSLDHLDPASIKSVEVVKGAAGERLYGPRGAKGVIVVLTKEKKP